MTDDLTTEPSAEGDGIEYWYRIAVKHENHNRELQDEIDRLTGSNLKLAMEVANAHDKMGRLTALTEKHLERKQQAEQTMEQTARELEQAREDLAEMRRMRDSAGETVEALNERIAAFGNLADMYDTGDARSKAVATTIRRIITTGKYSLPVTTEHIEHIAHPDTPTPLPKRRESMALLELMKRVGALQARLEGVEAQVTDTNTRGGRTAAGAGMSDYITRAELANAIQEEVDHLGHHEGEASSALYDSMQRLAHHVAGMRCEPHGGPPMPKLHPAIAEVLRLADEFAAPDDLVFDEPMPLGEAVRAWRAAGRPGLDA